MKNSTFNHIIGNENAKNELEKILSCEKIPHSWLISGPKGIGKNEFAFAIVKKLFSNLPSMESRLLMGTIPDFMHITKEDAKEINAEKIRDIGNFLALTAAESLYRIVLIDDADSMNKFASNALLKILEEPPSNAVIILISHNPAKLLPTIKSRCHQLKLYPLSDEEFTNKISVIPFIKGMSNGCPGFSKTLLKNNADQIYQSLLNGLSNNRPSWIFDFIEQTQILKDEEKWQIFTFLVAYIIENVLKIEFGNFEDEEKGKLSIIAKNNKPEEWIKIYYEIHNIFSKINRLNLDKKHSIIIIKSMICKE